MTEYAKEEDMPRKRGPRVVDEDEKEEKAPSEPTRYTKAPELSAIADRLIPSPGLGLGHLAGSKIAFEFTTAKQIGCNGVISAGLWPARMRPWGKYDFLIMASRFQFDASDARICGQGNGPSHRLLHLGAEARGVPALRVSRR
jgi:hypothetical protein